MKKPNVKLNIRITLGIFVALFAILIVYLAYSVAVNGESWFASAYNPRISTQKTDIDPGSIYDRNGNLLAYTSEGERYYSDNYDVRRAVSHVVGDSYGKTVGAETFFAKYLYGYNKGVLERIYDAAGDTSGGSDIYLTIDSALSEYIYDNMDFRGGAVVMNYKTGEILASVSKPTFDPQDLESVDESDSVYVNRVTQGKYPPGSTFKIITLAAALENGIDFEYNCTGEEIISGQKITCVKDGGHGTMNLQQAFEHSCNTYFGKLAVEIGAEKLSETAKKFGYNCQFNLSDLVLYTSDFNSGENDGDTAWAGIGQYKDLVTPLHNAMIVSAIANGGTMPEPKLLYGVNYNGNSTFDFKAASLMECTDSATAATIKEYMRSVVESGTGTSAQIGGYTVCGKTGTAEYTEDGEVKNHSWFVAFVDDPDHPIAVSVVLEGAGYGSSYAAPLAGQILSRAIDMGY